MPEATAARPRVLLVDDDATFAEHLSLLMAPRYRIVAASGSRAALATTVRECVQAAVLDLHMPAFLCNDPALEGVALARELHRRLGDDFPILFVTRSAPPNILPTLIGVANGVYTKPVHVDRLSFHLDRLIGRSRQS